MTPSQKLSGSDQNHQEKSQWADGDDGKDNQELAEKVLKKVETLDQCLLNHQTIDSIQSLNYFQRSTEIFHIRSITSATVNNDSNKRTGIVSIDLDSSSSSSSSRPSFHNLTNNTQPIRFISDPENLIESNQPLVAVRFDPSLQSLNLSFNFYLNHSKLVNSLTTLDHSHTGTGSKPKVAFIASDSINSLYQLLTNLTSSSTLTDQTSDDQLWSSNFTSLDSLIDQPSKPAFSTTATRSTSLTSLSSDLYRLDWRFSTPLASNQKPSACLSGLRTVLSFVLISSHKTFHLLGSVTLWCEEKTLISADPTVVKASANPHPSTLTPRNSLHQPLANRVVSDPIPACMSQPLLDWSGSLISRQATSRSSLSSLPINFNPLTHSSTVGTTASLAITSTSSPSPTLNLTSTHSSPSNQNLDPTLTSQTPTRSSSRRRPISSLYKIGGSLHSMLSKPQNHSPPQSSINDSQQAQLSKSQTQTSSSSQDQALSIPVTSAQLSSNYYPSTTLTDPIILDSSELEDGPLFRATLLGLERRAHQLKKSLKSLIRGFEKMHLGITTSLEAYDRMEEALRLVDDLSPAAFRPLNQCYYQSAHVTFGKIDKERIERLELHTIGPLKKLSQGFKTLETFKKNFEYECKTYDEFMRQYLSTKFDEEIDLKRARQMKIRFTFARKYYHHKLYELTILYETKVLDILSENMKFEHLSRHLTRELDQLGQQLDLFYVEVKKNRAKIEQQIQCSQDNLKSLERQLKLVTEELESHRFEGAGFGSGYHHLIRSSTSYRSTPGSQRYPTSFPPVVDENPASFDGDLAEMGNQSHNKSHDFGEKLIGFALSIAGRASDGSNLNRKKKKPGAPHRPGHHERLFTPDPLRIKGTDETIPQKSNFPAISPIKTSAPDIVPSFQLKTSEAYLTQKDQLETNLSEAFKEPIQKKEGFLLSCTKNYTASSSKRRTSFSIHSPTSSQFKRHDTSFKSRPTTSSGGGGSQNHISGQSSSHDSGNRNWKKVWCVLALGEFREYSGESYLTETSRSKIDLRFAMVRERGGRDDRKFSFEIVTSQFVRIYQASNHEEMKEWISAIESCIESLLNGLSSNRDIKNRSALKPSKKKRTIDTSKRLSGQFSLLPSEQVIRPSAKLINKSGSDSSALEFMNIRRDSDIGQTERKPRPNSIGLKTVDSEAKNKKQEAEKSDEEEYETVEGENEEGDDDEEDGDDFDQEEEKRIRLKLALVEELDRLAKSSKCAECGRPNPRWASYNLGILICIRCSGIHRSLGSHISKVRSIDLDDWSEEQVKNIREIGNLKSKSIWEFKLMKDKTSETVGKGKEEEKDYAKFIKDKYLVQKYIK